MDLQQRSPKNERRQLFFFLVRARGRKCGGLGWTKNPGKVARPARAQGSGQLAQGSWSEASGRLGRKSAFHLGRTHPKEKKPVQSA